MAEQGKGLNDEQRRARAEMLEGPPVGAAAAGEASAMPNRCASAPLGNPLTGPRWNGWGAGLANTRFQPAAAAGLTASQVPALTLKWAFGFPGSRSAYQQPTVASGRVYAGADTGFVHSLDAGSGCVQLVVPRAGGCANGDQRRIAARIDATALRDLLRRREGERVRGGRGDRTRDLDGCFPGRQPA